MCVHAPRRPWHLPIARSTPCDAVTTRSLGSDLHNASFPQYKIHRAANLAPDTAEDVVQLLRKAQQNVSGLWSFADSEPQALRWGEIIPLSFLSNATLSKTQLVVLSHPLRRYNHTKDMVPELLDVGGRMFDYFDALPQRVAVLASSDLAHTHLAAGPYGYSPAAEPFDQVRCEPFSVAQ